MNLLPASSMYSWHTHTIESIGLIVLRLWLRFFVCLLEERFRLLIWNINKCIISENDWNTNKLVTNISTQCSCSVTQYFVFTLFYAEHFFWHLCHSESILFWHAFWMISKSSAKFYEKCSIWNRKWIWKWNVFLH